MTQSLLPSHRKSGKGATFGWLASTSVAALLVSALSAWALSVQSSGQAIGDMDEAVLVMLPPVPALEAISEPSPDAADQAPSEQVEAPDAEDLPDMPELTEAPDMPQDLPDIEEIALDQPPEPALQPPPPKPVVELPKPKPKPEKKREEKRKERAEKPKEERREKPKRKASEAASASKASSAAAPAQASAGEGKASAKSYGAQVMKKVNRTRKRTAGERGEAVVVFSIGAGGDLTSVSIGQSSGSAKLDQVAAEHIRRSAPFPPPPPGVKTSFSFRFVAK